MRSTGLAEREGNRTTRTYGSIQDVADQRAASDALRESEEKLRAILEHASVTVFCGTPEGVFRYISPPVQKTTGFTPEEYVGRYDGATAPAESAGPAQGSTFAVELPVGTAAR